MDLNGGMVENKLENLSPYQWMEQHFFARQIPRDWPSLLALYLNFHGRLGRVELALRGALLSIQSKDIISIFARKEKGQDIKKTHFTGKPCL